MAPEVEYSDKEGVTWRIGDRFSADDLLTKHHYLGPLRSGGKVTILGVLGDEPVAAAIWKHPTSRNLPSDGSWLELARWCLTPAAGENAGTRMHRWSLKLLKNQQPTLTTLVSYSDPGHGHTGSLYRACNWQWAPTWHRLRTPPTGNGDWGTGPQGVKDRWVFCVGSDPDRNRILSVGDTGALRHWLINATTTERHWASRSLNLKGLELI